MDGHRENGGSANEMEQIRRGLEQFLQQELAKEPQFFTIEKDETEEEIDVINASRPKETKRSARREAYEEDWDSREGKNTRKGNRAARSQSSGRGGGRRNAGSQKQAHKKQSEENNKKNSQDKNGKAGRQRKGKKKKSRLQRFLITVLVIMALLAAGLYYMVGQVYSKMNYRAIESTARLPMQEDGVVNILLIGNDSRENGADGRSDAMILLSVSSRAKKIYMTSLLRDMYVEIPGHDGNRLNAAYSYGGAELLMETIERNLDITVNRYVLVNFEAFANLVDAVDGVDLELSKAEIELVNGYLNEYNMLLGRPIDTDYMDVSVEGMVHLNGPQALAYTRNRYIGTDFGRTERQRKVLAEVIRKLPKAVLTNPKELTDGLMPNLTTNLTQWECYRLSLMAPKFLVYDMEQASVPLGGTYKDANIRGMAVLEVDFDANKKYLRKLLFEAGETENVD